MNAKKLTIAFYTILKKEVKRIIRIWPQTMIPPLITTSLYFLIFGGVLFGDKVVNVGGNYIEYIIFLLPGLIMMSVITNSYNSPVSSLFTTKMFKNIEELIISPTPTWIIILGFAFGSMFRSILNVTMIYAAAYYFVPVLLYDWLMALIILLFTSFFFALAGIINAILAKTFDDISWFPSFILTPMVYLGGVFFSIEMLPVFWQKIALMNPVYYFINLFRFAFLGIGYFDWEGFLIIIFGNITLFIFAIKLFNNKIKQ